MIKVEEAQALVKVEDIKKYFPVRGRLFSRDTSFIKAVDKVSFIIPKGRTLGIVGESGCGKTTLAKLLLRLIEPDEGKIYFNARKITGLSCKQLASLRKDIQIVFQDPFNSLDPRFTIYSIIKEGIANFFREKGNRYIDHEIRKIVDLVGLQQNSLYRYPHEFSGGQRQRISIARSLILKPSLLVLDEPVSSLDVSIQAQIINLLLDLQRKFSLSYLFIAHDLDVVKTLSDTICVMYKGKIVEEADTEELFSNPLHPYTRLLIDSSQGKRRELKLCNLPGNKGCVFESKCRHSKQICENQPLLKKIKENHKVACWLYG